jgi:hypothetical protein
MREEILSIMKKVNKTGKYSQYKSNKKLINNSSDAGFTPIREMNINNNYTPVLVGGDYQNERMTFSVKKKINITR